MSGKRTPAVVVLATLLFIVPLGAQAMLISVTSISNRAEFSSFSFTGIDENDDGLLDHTEILSFSGMTWFMQPPDPTITYHTLAISRFGESFFLYDIPGLDRGFWTAGTVDFSNFPGSQARLEGGANFTWSHFVESIPLTEPLSFGLLAIGFLGVAFASKMSGSGG